jgi:hypothetical protein
VGANSVQAQGPGRPNTTDRKSDRCRASQWWHVVARRMHLPADRLESCRPLSLKPSRRLKPCGHYSAECGGRTPALPALRALQSGRVPAVCAPPRATSPPESPPPPCPPPPIARRRHHASTGPCTRHGMAVRQSHIPQTAHWYSACPITTVRVPEVLPTVPTECGYYA